MTKKSRHHANPLLRIFAPGVHGEWRKEDLFMLSNSEHMHLHSQLQHSECWCRLLAEAYELESERFCSEEEFASILDDIWNEFALKHQELEACNVWC